MQIFERTSERTHRLRKLTLRNVINDVKLVRTGLLDAKSLLDGYRKWENPCTVTVRDESGAINALRYSHNARTNAGGTQQAARMGSASGNPANQMALNGGTVSGSFSTSLTADISLNALPAEIASGATGSPTSLYRGVATYVAPTISSTGSATATGTFTLTRTFTNNSSPSTAYYVNGIGMHDVATSGGCTCCHPA